MHTHHKVFYLLVLLILSCCENEPEFTPRVKIDGTTISCNYCSHFADVIEVQGNDIIVSGTDEVLVYQYKSGLITHNQTFNYGKTSGIQEITIKEDEMAIGVAGSDGTGTVYIYKKDPAQWTLVQTLTVGISGDNFGGAIDFNQEWMIVGANGKWRWRNPEPYDPKAYIYRKEGNLWVEHNVLPASTSSVALYDRYFFIGGKPTHQYQLVDADWVFFKLDSLIMHKIFHDDNLFISSDVAYGGGLVSWRLNADGTKTFVNIASNFENMELSGHGELIEIVGNLALVDTERNDNCFLIELINDQWVNKLKLTPYENQSNTFEGLAIGNGFLVVGGRNDHNVKGIDNFILYVWPL
jgi:hypothetical protein